MLPIDPLAPRARWDFAEVHGVSIDITLIHARTAIHVFPDVAVARVTATCAPSAPCRPATNLAERARRARDSKPSNPLRVHVGLTRELNVSIASRKWTWQVSALGEVCARVAFSKDVDRSVVFLPKPSWTLRFHRVS